MVKTPRPRHAPEESVIYKIPCGEHSCKEAYFGQTCRGLKKSHSEHVAAYNKRDQQSPFVLHRYATDHSPGWKMAEVVHKDIGSKKKRLFFESALIRTNQNINSGSRQRGDFCLGKIPALATLPRPLAT